MSTVIKVENLSKAYRLGVIGSGTLREDLNRWWARARGKPAPYLKVDREDHGNVEGETVWALRDISFEVGQGEILGIIGANGAGKSTLLKILSRITAPTSGRVELQGRVGSLLEVGTGFHPELTGRENVYLNGAILGMTRAEIDRKFDEIVDFSGVETYIDTPVKRYSSGMRVRLGFAVAAHLDPEILLVDEVLAVGDHEFQKKCLGKMGQVAGEGRTVLFVSHIMPSIEALCSRAILLADGQVVLSGRTISVVEHYLGQTLRNAESYVDIRTHAGRTSSSKPVFQSVRLLDQQGDEKNAMRVGEPIIFELRLDAKEHRIKSPHIQINIRDRRDISVVRFASDMMTTEQPEISGKYRVCLYWEKCRLIPGIYTANLQIRDAKIHLDKIVNAFTLEVNPVDIYGTGRLDSHAGLIVPEGVWEFQQIDG